MKTRYQELTWPLQLNFLCLLEGGLVCALWQKAHPNLTLCLLALAPILMLLSRIPHRFFPGFLRQTLQLALVALGIIWFQQRSPSTQLDLALIECAAVFSLALLLGGRLREHSLMGILAVAFAGYGGLAPGRSVFLPSFLLALLLGLLLLYQTRILLLSRIRSTTPVPLPPYSENWLYRSIHFLLLLSLGVFLLLRFPIRDRLRTKGLAPVSFAAEEDLAFPEIWKNWFKPTKKLISPEKSPETTGQGEQKPTEISEQAQQTIADSAAQAIDAREGFNGSGSIGKDLVFRAYTPAKLYWVMQIYDQYDGTAWTRSNTMLQGRSAIDRYRPQRVFPVVQTISIEKMNSIRLPYAFRPTKLQFRNTLYGQDHNAPVVIHRSDAVSFTLRMKTLIEPPWNYRVHSLVPAPDLQKRPRPWNEPERSFGWTYRALPRNIISTRLRNLALDITKDCKDPLQKATAIRDFLRNNYKYNLDAPPTPEGREAVDYFLFEAKEGFCQHFAQALVVLARLAGLHARLVTGYSPGKFNVMGNFFEIYEYHAHAWAHVFIEPYGWLTFDGVAPANVNPQDSASLLSSMLDPFGEKWTQSIPELAFVPPRQALKGLAQAKAQEKQKSSESADPAKGDFFTDVYEKASRDCHTPEPGNKELLKAAIALSRQRLLSSLASAIAFAKNKSLDAFQFAWRHALQAIRNLARNPLSLYAAAVIAALIGAIHRNRKLLAAALARQWKRRRCKLLWRKILSPNLSPARKITACQTLNNTLLELAGFPRPAPMDALERSSLFPPAAHMLAQDYNLVATAAFQAWYSSRTPEIQEAEQVIQAAGRFQIQLKLYLKHR